MITHRVGGAGNAPPPQASQAVAKPPCVCLRRRPAPGAKNPWLSCKGPARRAHIARKLGLARREGGRHDRAQLGEMCAFGARRDSAGSSDQERRHRRGFHPTGTQSDRSAGEPRRAILVKARNSGAPGQSRRNRMIRPRPRPAPRHRARISGLSPHSTMTGRHRSRGKRAAAPAKIGAPVCAPAGRTPPSECDLLCVLHATATFHA